MGVADSLAEYTMGVADSLADFFAFDEHDTDLGTETTAGATTFLAMAYIIVVNPSILAPAIVGGFPEDGQVPTTEIAGETYGFFQVVEMLTVVTILASVVAILVMALYANRPFGLAPGLGLNAFFAFTVVLGLGVPWQVALAAVFVEGVIFIALTAVGAREYVIRLFPTPVKFSVGVGIGLFLAIIGLEAMHITAGSPATFLQFNPVFARDPIAIISVIGLFVTFGLYARGSAGRSSSGSSSRRR